MQCGVCLGIFPGVRVQCLASDVLELSLRQLPADFQRLQSVRPVLVKTYVSDQHEGTYYRASNSHYLDHPKCAGRGPGQNAKQWLSQPLALPLLNGYCPRMLAHSEVRQPVYFPRATRDSGGAKPHR